MLRPDSTEENFSCKVSRRHTLIWFGAPVLPALVITLLSFSVYGDFGFIHLLIFQITYDVTILIAFFTYLFFSAKGNCCCCFRNIKIWTTDPELMSVRIDACVANGTMAFQNEDEFDEISFPAPVARF